MDRIKREALAFKPDLIGFSVVTNQYPNALQIAEALKSKSKVEVKACVKLLASVSSSGLKVSKPTAIRIKRCRTRKDFLLYCPV